MLEKLKGATLSPDKQALADKAKTFYANFDFLDAYRLALAASTCVAMGTAASVG